MATASSSRNFLAALLIGGCVLVGIIFAPFISVFILALVFGVIFSPLNKWLAKHLSATPAAMLTTTIIVLIIVGPVVFVLARVIREASGLIIGLQSGASAAAIDTIQNRIHELMPSINVDLVSIIDSVLRWIVSRLDSIFSSALTVVINLFLSIIALVYWFKDANKLHTALMRLSPLSDEDTRTILDKLRFSIHGVIRGSMIVAFAQGIVAWIGFGIFGIPNGILWGAVTVICALIPTLGTGMVVVPTVAYLLFVGHVPQAIGMLIWGVCAVGLIDNVIGPYIMTRGSNIHPFFILIAVLGGIEFFGPIGLFAGPLVLSCFFALLDVYSNPSSNAMPEKVPVKRLRKAKVTL